VEWGPCTARCRKTPVLLICYCGRGHREFFNVIYGFIYVGKISNLYRFI
jgi:hypothetical protein